MSDATSQAPTMSGAQAQNRVEKRPASYGGQLRGRISWLPTLVGILITNIVWTDPRFRGEANALPWFYYRSMFNVIMVEQ